MDRRFSSRKEQMLAECRVSLGAVKRLPTELTRFMNSFTACLGDAEQRQHAHHFCEGLLGNVARKNTEAIAYEHDQERRNLQHFIGGSTWDHAPLIDELCRQVGRELGSILPVSPSKARSRSASRNSGAAGRAK
jgi:hypothetical protein